MTDERIAIVLMNLGGPDRPESIRPFLFNLFNDPAIIGFPGPLRWLLAKLISGRRAKVAKEIYAKIGGRSPLLDQTKSQGKALEMSLASRGIEAKCFIAMRYWHPMTKEAVAAVKAWQPDKIILLPLYPQYSRTTTGSSLQVWSIEAKKQNLEAVTTAICCYPVEPGMVQAQADLITKRLGDLPRESTRILFSAHGLPKSVIAGGDPYQRQIEKTVQAVVEALSDPPDWVVCYQSRVGPVEWIGPSTDDEIKRAGSEEKAVMVVPIAFVSEHSETLVELDIEYAGLAREAGVTTYARIPALSDHPTFVEGLANLVVEARDGCLTRCVMGNPGFHCASSDGCGKAWS